jgi:putative nucleotidyltransferase with HDIG domain
MKATPEYIVQKLCEHGFETYVVGGAVRDFLQGKNAADEDIVTSARPEQIQELFADHKIVLAGTYFKVTFVDEIEVATFRKDRYLGLSDKKVEVTYANTITEDLSRRDLTINAMAFCRFTGDVIDPYHGRDDLKRRMIRFVGDAEERIKEDPNRIIRACRFLAAIDGVFSKSTREVLQKYGHYIKEYVAKERVQKEIMKAMKVREASAFFNALHEIGVLKDIFPSLECCYEFGDLHGVHHKESIITHSYVAGDSISTKYPLVKLAAYLHDIGKPYACTWNPKTSDLKFKGHDVEGQKILEKELSDLKFPKKEISQVTALTRLHMHNFKTPKATRKTLKTLQDYDLDWRDLYRLKLADGKANVWKGEFPLKEIRADLERIKNAFDVKSPNRFEDLEINGNDIIKITGISPGPYIGRMKEYLLEATVDDPSLNNHETLTQLVKEKISEWQLNGLMGLR